MLIEIEKHWDGNECETEGANGRIYVSRGRWQWLVVVDGETDSTHDLRRDARARRDALMKPRQRAISDEDATNARPGAYFPPHDGRCAWFARCTNPATGTTPHPVVGDVPTCDRCHKFATGEDRSATHV